MSNASASRRDLPGEQLDPLLLVAAGIGLVALALLGIAVYAVLAAFDVAFQPSGWLFLAAVSVVLVLVTAGVVVYGRRLNGRPRPEVQYRR